MAIGSLYVVSSLSPFQQRARLSRYARQCEAVFAHPETQAVRQQILAVFPFLSLFNPNDICGQDFFALSYFENPQLITTWQNTAGCNLHNKKVASFVDQQLLMFYFGICIDDESLSPKQAGLFKFLHGRDQIADFVSGYPHPFLSAILVPFKTSKNEFMQWIDEHWDEISKTSKAKLPECVSPHLPKNLQIGVEINELLKQKLTYKEISDFLYNKYPNDDRLNEDSKIKVIYHRLVEYTKKQLLANKILQYLWGNTKQ